MVYHQQAAATGINKWSVVNPTLYTTCFTRAERTETSCCKLYFVTSHSDQECAQQGDLDPGLPDQLRAVESVMLSLLNGTSASSRHPPPVIQPLGEICRLWNSGMCRFHSCCHTHLCELCRGKHPAIVCPRKGGQPGQNRPPGNQGKEF